ncbi:DnaB-like helicase C-terminal domain-containing protein [Paenibacillus sp. LjRoot56]|uniref:DnaB-like helicase C-terminal domain-containing protein n=1 Tax=Paenibacillus sp. LjRoot56 TaxID=3342333 RepID=UPI003ECCC24F
MDIVAEKTIIKAMMNGLMEEVTDQVPFYLFQSPNAQETVRKMYEMKGAVTFNTMLLAKRFNSDYINDCQYMRFEKDDLPYFINKLKVAHVKKLGLAHIRELNKLITTDCKLEDLTTLLRNGVSIDYQDTDSKLTIMPSEYASDHFQAIVDRAINPEIAKGIQLKAFPELNDTFYRLLGGDLILLCAQSGHGKTALALNITNDLSVTQDYIGYYANAEMRDEELSMRIVSMRSGIPTTEVMTSQFSMDMVEALDKISAQYDLIGKKNLVLSRIPVMTINSIRRGYKKLMNAGKKPDYILIDYLGRMELEGNVQGLQEWQKMYRLSEDIKTLAVELDVPIIALSQLNDEGQIEGAKKMKNACDGVLFFEPILEDDNDKMNEKQKQYANYRIVKFKVRRNDNSKPIYINFTKKYQRISEVF